MELPQRAKLPWFEIVCANCANRIHQTPAITSEIMAQHPDREFRRQKQIKLQKESSENKKKSQKQST
jgi:hypothetical protein